MPVPQLNTRVLFIPAALSLAVLLLAFAPGGCPRMPDDLGSADPNSATDYDVWNGAGDSDETLVDGETDTNAGDTTTVRVYPPVYFDLDVTEGDVPLTVVGQAYTMDGEPLPDGEYVWNWGDQEEGGPVTNFWRRGHTYVKTGTYAVGLSILVAGLVEPIVCTQAQDGKYEQFAKIKASATLAGQVYDAQGLPLAGVQVTTTDGLSAKTGPNGRYSMRVPHRWSGTVTPSRDGYTFSPPNRDYVEVTQSYSGQNYAEPAALGPGVLEVLPADGLASTGYIGGPFTPESQTYVLTNTGGSTLNWTAAATQSWVTMPIAGSALGAGESIRVTVSIDADANNLPVGSYSDTVLFTNATDGRGDTTRTVSLTVTPYTIAGRVRDGSNNPISGVIVSADNGGGAFTTGADGTYSVTVPYDWSGRVAPSKAGWTFGPPYGDYTDVTTSQSDQNYTGTVQTFTISGHVADGSGTAISDVTIGGLPNNPSTNASGDYTATVNYGWSGTATPSKGGYTFTPENRTYGSVTENQASEDYTATATDVMMASSVSQYGITWTFDHEYQVGQFVNGDWWVVGPISIVAMSPGHVLVDGRHENGAMLNPSPENGYTQGYDSMMYRDLANHHYDQNLNIAYQIATNGPYEVPTGSLVSTLSWEPLGPINFGIDKYVLTDCAVLTVVPEVPANGSFRPPYSGSDKSHKAAWNTSQIRWDRLASLAPVGMPPLFTALTEKLQYPFIDHVPGWMGQDYVHVRTALPGYGRDMSNVTGQAMLLLNCAYTDLQKQELLYDMIQLGIDLYGILLDGGHNNWKGCGGEASGRYGSIVFAGWLLEDPNLYNVGINATVNGGTYRFGDLEQTFYVTHADIGRIHHYPGWPPNGEGNPPYWDDKHCWYVDYVQSDLGLAEWGIEHQTNPDGDNKAWNASYRIGTTATSWGGHILTARIMGIQSLWRHDAIFDYQDRFVATETGVYQFLDPWTKAMWEQYRQNYP